MLAALRAMGGLDRVTVVIGAQADRVAAVLPAGTDVVVNADHRSGLGSSVRLGLEHAGRRPAVDAVLLMLVDLPEVTADVIDRLAAAARRSPHPRSVLARASYAGSPGHPVLLGRDHLAAVIEDSGGDAGARTYLAQHSVELVECGDIGGGRDVDRRADLGGHPAG